MQVVTVPGIGVATAAVLIAQTVDIQRFPTPEHDPRRLAPVQKEWDAVMTRGVFTAAVRPQGIMDWDDLYKVAKEKQKGFKVVHDQFARYWTDGWKADWAVKQGDKGEAWADLQPKLLTMNVDSVDNAIHALADLRARVRAAGGTLDDIAAAAGAGANLAPQHGVRAVPRYLGERQGKRSTPTGRYGNG